MTMPTETKDLIIPAVHVKSNDITINKTEPHELIKRKAIRSQIYALQNSLFELVASNEAPKEMGVLKHYFIKGLYARELFIPAGTAMVSKLHKFPRLCMIMQGEVTFTTEYGSKRVVAPYTAEFLPGSKVALYTHSDVIWTAIFATDYTDIDTIEDYLTAENHDDYDIFCKSLSIKEGEESCL
jgi:hypothetical protein